MMQTEFLPMLILSTLDRMSETRSVKRGVCPTRLHVFHHWAIQVGDGWWYEIESDQEGNKKSTKVKHSRGAVSAGGAGSHGINTVGETSKADSEINEWITDWSSRNPTYNFVSQNCQNFATDFMRWLTDDKFTCEPPVAQEMLGNFTEPSI